MPVTLEDINRELARRSAPPSGVSLGDVNAELKRRAAPEAATPAFDPSQMVAQGRETLSQENIGRVLGMAAAPGIGTAAAFATRAAPMAFRAAATGLGVGAGDVGQQAGESIRGEREGIDPAQAAIAAGLGAGGQAVGELAGAALPGVVRRLARKGPEGRQTMQKAIADAERFGQTPTVAQATENPFLSTVEGIVSKYPGGAGVFRKKVKSATDALRGQLDQQAQKGIYRGLDPTRGGLSVKHGTDNFIDSFSRRAEPLFDEVTDRVGLGTPTPATNTLKTVQELTATTPGAERTTARLTSPFLREIAEDLAADAGPSGAMPFQALQAIRTKIGSRLSNPALLEDASTAEVKRLYGAISEDLKAQAYASGAKNVWDRANSFWRAGRSRIDDILAPLIGNKTPEKIYKSLVSGAKDGPTQLRTTMRSLKPEQQDAVTGTMIKQLGTPPPSMAGEAPEFSFSSFMTQWNQIDDAARDAFFKRGRNPQLGQDLQALADWAGRIRRTSKAFANPSGTAGTLGGFGGAMSLGSAITAPVLGSGALVLPLVYGGSVLGANRIAALMTSPKVVNWLAKATRLDPAGMSAHLGRLSGIAAKEDPETKEAIMAYLNSLQNEGP